MNGLAEWLAWTAALLVYPLLASDTRSPAWAFLLGAELAVGLTAFLLIVSSAIK